MDADNKWILFPVVVIGSIRQMPLSLACIEPSDVSSEVQKVFTIFICEKFKMTHLRCGQHSWRTGDSICIAALFVTSTSFPNSGSDDSKELSNPSSY